MVHAYASFHSETGVYIAEPIQLGPHRESDNRTRSCMQIQCPQHENMRHSKMLCWIICDQKICSVIVHVYISRGKRDNIPDLYILCMCEIVPPFTFEHITLPRLHKLALHTPASRPWFMFFLECYSALLVFTQIFDGGTSLDIMPILHITSYIHQASLAVSDVVI